MKLVAENKIEIYRLKKKGYLYKELAKKFKIDPSNVRYMVKLADLHDEIILIKGKNNYYSSELKLDIINEVLIIGNSIYATSLYVEELKKTHKLNILLKILGLSRSSYYYTKNKEDKDKNTEEAILLIQEKNKYRYGL
ncbi:hypothetical protein [uncultured Gemella sp.]|uniref:hypothetical protein n=1 Tax=uncultured Gemella sp. TaxID=254352 RepID=UPI0028E30BBA|nr:hypothetical protein [uncultured Gemella sp.]